MVYPSPGRRIAEYSFMVIFAKDKLITMDELKMLERIALEDQQVDEEEKQVLHNIFERLDTPHLDPEVREEIQRFRREYGID